MERCSPYDAQIALFSVVRAAFTCVYLIIVYIIIFSPDDGGRKYPSTRTFYYAANHAHTYNIVHLYVR